MKKTVFPLKCVLFVVTAAAVSIGVRQLTPFAGTVFAEARSGAQEKREKRIENYDIRTDEGETARRQIEIYAAAAGKTDAQVAASRRATADAAASFSAAKPNLKIEYSEDLRVPEVISPVHAFHAAFLTAPAAQEKRSAVFTRFLENHSALFGLDQAQVALLDVTADYTNPDGNLSFVHLQQKIGGVPVFRGEVKAGFTKRGEIVRIINNLAPHVDYETAEKDFGTAERAVVSAASYINLTAGKNDMKIIEKESSELKRTFESGRFSQPTTAEKMYFPVETGVVRAAWRVLLWTPAEAFYVIVDAADGALLWRKKITEYQTRPATFNVYGSAFNMLKTEDSPAPQSPGCLTPLACPQPPLIARQSFTLIGNEAPYTFNNLGWIPDNGLAGLPNQSDNITDGNAVEAGVDRVSPNGVDAPVAGSPNRVFNFAYNPAPGNPPPGEDPLLPEYQKGAVTNAFYVVNRWHDEIYLFGFTEPAGNFQHFNFGRGGAEGDRISAEIQDASGFNNANFAAPADGGRPRMQMYLWNTSTPMRDGSLDAHVLVHETTHGLSTRLHGNATGLATPMAAGLGEGWSDLYPLAMLTEPTDSPFTLNPVGGYASLGLFPGNSYYYGARRFPYALRSVTGPNGYSHSPITLANLNTGNCTNFNSAYPPRFTSTACGAPLFIGELWAAALWEVRGQLVLRHGAVEGNRRVLQIVTDAMKLSPLNPTVLQGRDAVLVAAQANTVAPETSSDLLDAWRGFAIRGIGAGAQIVSTNPVNVVESFSVPASVNNRPKRADFDGDGRADVSVFRAGDGTWYANRSSAGFTAVNWGTSGDQIVPGDYDGDDKTDAAVYRAATGQWFILNSGSTTFSAVSFGVASDVPAAADFDGDGRADISVFRPSNGTWYRINSANGQFSAVPFGAAGDKPVTSDFDGDGKADTAVFRPSTGDWHILQSSNNQPITVNFGAAGDQPAAADYDGDNRDDIAVFRPSNGTWYRLNSSNNQFAAVNFGQAGDVPVPGDYDGDNRDDVAVYRSGNWYILQSGSGFFATQFGTANDLPIANRYLP